MGNGCLKDVPIPQTKSGHTHIDLAASIKQCLYKCMSIVCCYIIINPSVSVDRQLKWWCMYMFSGLSVTVPSVSCSTKLILNIFNLSFSKALQSKAWPRIATAYGLDDWGVGVQVPVGSRIFSSPHCPDRLWGPPNLLSNGYQGSFPRGKAAGAWSLPLTSS
jgi:hypothetical protein